MSVSTLSRDTLDRESRSISRRALALAPLLLNLTAAFALLLLSACESPKSLFAWGHYQDSVYDVSRGAGEADLTKDIQILSQEVDRARAEGQKVAPGIHAHLGYLYYLSGNSGAAVAQFNAEKELYPESATFIDGMLSRMKS